MGAAKVNSGTAGGAAVVDCITAGRAVGFNCDSSTVPATGRSVGRSAQSLITGLVRMHIGTRLVGSQGISVATVIGFVAAVNTSSSFFMLVALQKGSKAARQPGVGLAGGGSSKS